MAGLVNAVANGVRNAMLSPEEIRTREEVKRIIPLAKVASAVVTAVALIFFVIFPNLFTAALLGFIGYMTYETHVAANSLKEMLENATIEFRAGLDGLRGEGYFNQMTQNAPILRMLGEAAKAWSHPH